MSQYQQHNLLDYGGVLQTAERRAIGSLDMAWKDLPSSAHIHELIGYAERALHINSNSVATDYLLDVINRAVYAVISLNTKEEAKPQNPLGFKPHATHATLESMFSKAIKKEGK